MGITVFGGGVDKSLCLPFGSLSTTPTFSATTSYTTVYSGTGSGYLDVALFAQGTGSIGFMRVTLDGVVVYEGQNPSGSGQYGGMINRTLIDAVYNGSSVVAYLKTLPLPGLSLSYGTAGSHPYTANTVGNLITVPNMDSFYFKSSILVEMKAGSAGNMAYYLAGGKTP